MRIFTAAMPEMDFYEWKSESCAMASIVPFALPCSSLVDTIFASFVMQYGSSNSFHIIVIISIIIMIDRRQQQQAVGSGRRQAMRSSYTPNEFGCGFSELRFLRNVFRNKYCRKAHAWCLYPSIYLSVRISMLHMRTHTHTSRRKRCYDGNYYVDAQAAAASILWMNWRHTMRRL